MEKDVKPSVSPEVVRWSVNRKQEGSRSPDDAR